MESRLSDRKLKPLPLAPFRHQNSAIARSSQRRTRAPVASLTWRASPRGIGASVSELHTLAGKWRDAAEPLGEKKHGFDVPRDCLTLLLSQRRNICRKV